MGRTSFALCLLFGLLTLGCDSQRKAGGPSPPSKKATSFPDCKADSSHPGPVAEAEWSGAEMCAQEQQKDAHMALPAVKISMDKCPGIHFKHDSDYRLDMMILSENSTSTCPANPFEKNFPFDSTKTGAKEFHTGKLKNKNAVGCTYEIYFKPKTGATCDPHIEGTP